MFVRAVPARLSSKAIGLFLLVLCSLLSLSTRFRSADLMAEKPTITAVRYLCQISFRRGLKQQSSVVWLETNPQP